jgi:hypothetical protein
MVTREDIVSVEAVKKEPPFVVAVETRVSGQPENRNPIPPLQD